LLFVWRNGEVAGCAMSGFLSSSKWCSGPSKTARPRDG
jgi:hypothetical protein